MKTVNLRCQSVLGLLAFMTSFLLLACSKSDSSGPNGPMRCKLESEKTVFLSEGRKKMCIYRCEDGSVEGRNRKPEQECLSDVNSAGG